MKSEVFIEAISPAREPIGAYVLVLSNNESGVKLPVIIKESYAHFIAIKLSDTKVEQPVLLDMFKKLLSVYSIKIQEATVYDVIDGMYCCKITSFKDDITHDFDCCVGDMLSIALVEKCPIYVDGVVLEKCANLTLDNSKLSFKQLPPKKPKAENLNKLLQDALDAEDYLLAAKLRDKIAKLGIE